MTGETRNIVGLFPAGGKATRVAPLPCSKEIYPVGFHPQGAENELRPKVSGHYLLEKLRQAGATKTYVILRPGKWDIPAYFADGKMLDMSLAYLMMDSSQGVPFTLDQAYSFVRHDLVVFGFPDIIFKPDDAFVRLLERQSQTGADLVLGLFPALAPSKVDMVELGQLGQVKRISIKPFETELHYAWLIAVWTPVFTQFIHDFVKAFNAPMQNENICKEIYLGHVIQLALNNQICVDSVIFSAGKYLDIGTPEDMKKIQDML